MKQKLKFLLHMIAGSKVFYVERFGDYETSCMSYNDCRIYVDIFGGFIKMKQ